MSGVCSQEEGQADGNWPFLEEWAGEERWKLVYLTLPSDHKFISNTI